MREVSVPERLRNPHPLVEATRRFYESVQPDEDGRMRPGPRERVAHLIVSRAALGRALRVLQAICREAARRGYTVTPSRGFEATGISILIGEHAYPVALHELHDRVPVTEDDLARWRKAKEWRLRWEPNLKPPTLKSAPNGYLKLLSPTWHGGRSSWSEGPRGPIDRKLPQFFEELARRAVVDDRREEERRQEESERQRQQAELLRQEKEQALRDANAERLKSELRDWRTAQDARAYAAALRGVTGISSVDLGDRLSEWVAWIERWADAIDPTAKTTRIAGLLKELPEHAHLQLGDKTSRHEPVRAATGQNPDSWRTTS